MAMPVARLMSMLAAQTLRHGGKFDGPDYGEEDILDELDEAAAAQEAEI